MTRMEAEVVRVRRVCNAGLREGDPFPLDRESPRESGKVCRVAFASVMMNVGRLRLLGSPLYVSCPDPGTGRGGNVILRIREVKSDGDD